jgi:hypothetical protein
MLCVVDEFTREALAIRVARKLGSADVIDVVSVVLTPQVSVPDAPLLPGL